jgi:hypothetical protein
VGVVRATTAAFLDSIQVSHQVAAQATILIDGADAGTVPILDGSVTLDQRAAIRGRCDITLTDDGSLDLVPTGPSSTLAPYGNAASPGWIARPA